MSFKYSHAYCLLITTLCMHELFTVKLCLHMRHVKGVCFVAQAQNNIVCAEWLNFLQVYY